MFNPNRMRVARERRGLTKARLAQDTGIALRGIKAYEAGETVPEVATVAKIAAILRFPVAFFDGDDLDVPNAEAVSFRAMTRMSASLRDSALGAASLAIELSRWIDARFRLPKPDVPDLRGMPPEIGAEALRAAWQLDHRPIKNLVHLLELRGVRVFSLVEKRAELDAFSFWRGDEPFVFLNTAKSGERGRFDAAHELGHLVLHRHGAQGREPEIEADRFASAFLMPRASVLELGRTFAAPTVDQLIPLKRRWRVSVGALARRLHDLDLVSEWHYRSLCIEIQTRGYRKREPEESPRETSQVLQKVFTTMRSEAVSKADIARELLIAPAELESLVFGLVMLPIAGGDRRPRNATPSRPNLRIVGSGDKT